MLVASFNKKLFHQLSAIRVKGQTVKVRTGVQLPPTHQVGTNNHFASSGEGEEFTVLWVCVPVYFIVHNLYAIKISNKINYQLSLYFLKVFMISVLIFIYARNKNVFGLNCYIQEIKGNTKK